ncbi:5-hydroxytryptamine receptor 2C, partial [Trichinella spiralis]
VPSINTCVFIHKQACLTTECIQFFSAHS